MFYPAQSSCVLPPVLSPPASDPFLKVLTHVGDDILRGCQCCLSEGWYLMGLIAATPSKVILLYSQQFGSCAAEQPLMSNSSALFSLHSGCRQHPFL